MSEELTTFSATRLAAMIRGREVSPVEVVEAYLRRVEVVNKHLNAVVTLAPDVSERAREWEGKLARGERAGPLAGVPLTVKDTIETAGLRTTFGSRLFAANVPGRDALAVARLREAGAIILGKTNTSELALDYTADNAVFGRTNNPHDFGRTPGGSSGGCAAAVASCMAAASVGSDLVGSIRIPAHFCGVAGLKPTAGRVPGDGHFPPLAGPYTLAASLGPLARRVEDLSLLFDVLAGESGASARGVNSRQLDSEITFLRGTRAAWYADDGVVPVSGETQAAVAAAARALEDAGLVVAEERPPHVERGTEMWLSLFVPATHELLRATYEGREDMAGPAARAVIGRAARSSHPTLPEYFRTWAERDRLRAELLRWMETTPLLVCPVGSVPAPTHGAGKSFVVGESVVGAFRAFGYAQVFNVFDLPAATVPAGHTPAGLPVGVQIVGRPNEERKVLAAARVVEEATGGWRGVPENLSRAGENPI